MLTITPSTHTWRTFARTSAEYCRLLCTLLVRNLSLTLHFEFGSAGKGCLCKRNQANAIQEAVPNKVFGPQKRERCYGAA